MNKTIGIFAHVDAGKTTFSECLLYHSNSIQSMGRVDHKNAYLDDHDIEKQRGITIFSQQGIFDYGDNTYFLVDTPGHLDFSPDTERAIMVLDYAILLISGVEGIQGHTQTLWNLLRKHEIPTFIFVNKLDREGASLSRVMEEIKEEFTDNGIYIDRDILDSELSNNIIEFLAEREETLLDLYMNDEYSKKLWLDALKINIKKSQIFPVFFGSALKDEGIRECFKMIDGLSYIDNNEDKVFGAIAYKVRYEDNTRITFVKINSGDIKIRDSITYSFEGEEFTEKITQIRLYNGSKFTRVDRAESGQLVGLVGLSRVAIGMGIGSQKNKIYYDMIPTLSTKVITKDDVNPKELVRVFKVLTDEEPTLNSYWSEELKELHLNIMGPIQLEILRPVLKERFDMDIDFGDPSIIYKETITNEVIGYGHFEPLKHYAEVHLKLESMPRGSGIIFVNKCHSDDLSKGNQNLVRHHIFEREHRGLLTGSAVTDMKITLLTGRGHNKHTSGGDFREATYRALRQGLEQADNILLEPFYRFTIKTSLDYMGRILNDIQHAKGSFEPPITNNNTVIIKGSAPVSNFMNYQQELIAITKGRGSIALSFDRYDLCHNPEDVIEEIGYDRRIDKVYTSSSIFCSKGQGYEVTWDKAKDAMHITVD